MNSELSTLKVIGDVTRHHAAQRGDKAALVCGEDGRTWTFQELDFESNQVANTLLDLDVRRQSRVAYLDKNSPEYFSFFLGSAKIDVVVVAVNWRLAASEMEYILNHSESELLVVGQEYLPLLSEMQLKTVRKVIVLGESPTEEYETYRKVFLQSSGSDPNFQVTPDSTCYQLYTSGTTGLPKGVELTHKNFMHCMAHALSKAAITPESVTLVCMPLFHIAGSGWGVVGIYHGARTVLLREVQPDKILEVMPAEHVSHSLFVPAVLQLLLAHPKTSSTDFSALEGIAYGASPISESVLSKAIGVFKCKFLQAYGLTESTGAITVLDSEDHDPGGPRAHLLRSCGKPVTNHEVRLVLDGADVPDGEVGEVWVRGPQVMKGYWRNPEATASSFVDGWFRTGDAAYKRDGYYFIHDRLKDMIISGGENVYPAEVENVLLEHSQIVDAAVIGVPDPRWGETVKAILISGEEVPSDEEVIAFCRKRLAGYKCPTSIEWREDMPRNASGKILKIELRKPYWEGRSRQVT